jgi:hypothetical protein
MKFENTYYYWSFGTSYHLWAIIVMSVILITIVYSYSPVYKILSLLALSLLVVILWIYKTQFLFIYIVYILAFISAVLMLFLSVVLMLPVSTARGYNMFHRIMFMSSVGGAGGKPRPPEKLRPPGMEYDNIPSLPWLQEVWNSITVSGVLFFFFGLFTCGYVCLQILRCLMIADYNLQYDGKESTFKNMRFEAYRVAIYRLKCVWSKVRKSKVLRRTACKQQQQDCSHYFCLFAGLYEKIVKFMTLKNNRLFLQGMLILHTFIGMIPPVSGSADYSQMWQPSDVMFEVEVGGGLADMQHILYVENGFILLASTVVLLLALFGSSIMVNIRRG